MKLGNLFFVLLVVSSLIAVALFLADVKEAKRECALNPVIIHDTVYVSVDTLTFADLERLNLEFAFIPKREK